MSVKDQEVMMKVLGEAVAALSEEFVQGAVSKFLTAIDSILADTSMTDVGKFGTIKVIMDLGWRRVTAVTHGDPNLSIEDLARARAVESGELSPPFLTGDEGMDELILESMRKAIGK